MMRQIKLTILFCLLAAVAQAQQPSLGQVARQNRTEQQARRQAVLELVQEITPRDVFERMMNQMYDATSAQFQAQMQRQGTTVPPDYSAKMKRVMQAVMSYDEMMQWSAEIYAKRFTVDEIHQLRDFYRSPLGQKMVRQMPEIMTDVMTRVSGIITTRMPEAMRKEGLMPPEATARP
jgi:hypothetical protein